MTGDCVFCKIVKGEIPSKKIYEDESLIVFPDLNPAAQTHFLIVPKKHIPAFLDVKNKDSDLIKNLIKVAQYLIEKKKIGKKYKLVVNGGGFQFVPHLHIHLLGGDLKKEV